MGQWQSSGVEPHPPRRSCPIQRSSAYDAAYLALASELEAELWTLDGPLYRNAASVGFPVRLFGQA